LAFFQVSHHLRGEMCSGQSVDPYAGFDAVACDVANVTTTDGDTSHYLQDPELFVDLLPQPFRRINRLLNSIVSDALEIAEDNESKLIHDSGRRQVPKYDSADILEVRLSLNSYLSVLHDSQRNYVRLNKRA